MTEDIEKFEKRSPGVPATQPTTDIVMMAIQNKLDPGLIEKMMDLAERNEKNLARKAYVKAMAAFKSDPPKIFKTKKAGFDHKSGGGRTEYSFAPLPDICAAIDPALSAQGLSYNWKHSQDDNQIIVTCIMTHELGHSESNTLKAPRDDSGKKNFIQQMGSTISYLERYTLLGVAGLATHGMDDDGKSSEPEAEFITEDQAKTIQAAVAEIYPDKGKAFFKWLGVESVETIPSESYKKAIKGLNEARRALEKRKGGREPGQEG